MKKILLLLMIISTFSCLSEFEGELGENIFENIDTPLLEITGHEKEVDLAEIFFTVSIDFLQYDHIRGIIILENGRQLQSLIDNPAQTSFIRTNLTPFTEYCYRIAYLDDRDNAIGESEEYCFSF